MKRTLNAVVVLTTVMMLTSPAAASLVAYWNFNTGSTTTTNAKWPGPISADLGSGTILTSGWGGWTDNFAGSTLNALNGDVAGASLSLVAGTNNAGNGTYIQLEFSTTGLQDLIVSFDTRGTSTGFDSSDWLWSTNGVTFTSTGISTATRSTAFSTVQVDLSGVSQIENAGSVYLRYVLSGATSNSGNNRLDNIQINATAIPEPATAGLLGLGVLLFRRRKAA